MATEKLTILHTNDIHSFFEQMPKVATTIKQLRSECADEEVLTIDCGDHMDRVRPETEGSNGIANIEVMNETGYELAVLGNNEGLTFLPKELAKLYREHAKFTVIGSNMLDVAEGEIPNWMVPYDVIQKGKLRIGVIGVTIDFTSFYELLGWDVRDPLLTTQACVEKLRDQVDIVIVLSHLGLNNDKLMAKTIKGIDCIFGGHTHHLLEEPLCIDNTYICAAGKFGRYVGQFQLQYDFEKRRITQARGRVVDVEAFANDHQVEHIVATYKAKSVKKLNEVIAEIKKPLHIDWNGESSLSNLLAAGIRKWTQAEIGIVNSGQLLKGIDAGTITRGMLLDICPSPINPCSMRLKGEHLKLALEESLLAEFVQLPIRGFGFRGKVLGTLCVDGMTITYDPKAPPYEKIKSIMVGHQPLQLEKDYVVGTIDMFTFGIGYTSFTKGKDVQFFLPEFIRDILQHEFFDDEALAFAEQSRWNVEQ